MLASQAVMGQCSVLYFEGSDVTDATLAHRISTLRGAVPAMQARLQCAWLAILDRRKCNDVAYKRLPHFISIGLCGGSIKRLLCPALLMPDSCWEALGHLLRAAVLPF